MRTASRSGFTLIEMIVVIAVMALVAGLVMVKQPWHSEGLSKDATLRALVDAMRLARSRAIAQDRAVTVTTGPRGFSVDGGSLWVVPPEEALTPSRVVFMPDGGSTGGTVILVAGESKIAVDVNWLTGRVRSREIDAP
jgi:general secretion pathway protein H